MVKVRLYGILQLAGMAIGLTSIIWLYAWLFSTLPWMEVYGQVTSLNSLASAFGVLFQYWTVIAVIALVIQLVSLFYLRSGLKDLCKFDRTRFSTPAFLALLLMIGTAVAGVAGISFLVVLQTYIPQISNIGSSYPPSSFFSWFFVSIGIVAVGGIIALVGLIGGVILGLWRIGDRYNRTVIKLGSIFSIMPFLSVVAPILIIVGAHEIVGQIKSAQKTGAPSITQEPSQTPIQSAAPVTTGKFCAQCGRTVPKEARFCPYCGKEASA